MKIIEAEVERFAQQYARLARAVNVHFGQASRWWKAWWVLRGLFNFAKHANNQHNECNRFLFFAKCAEPGPRYRPENEPHAARESFFSEFTENPANPANIAGLAMLMLSAFTAGSTMRKYVYNSVLFGRTAANESLNHMYAQWTLKTMNSTLRMKVSGDICANLTKNEVLDDLHASPMLRRRKRGKGSILTPRRPRRARTMSWQLRAKEHWTKGRLPFVNKFIGQQKSRLHQRKTRRASTVAKLHAARKSELEKMVGAQREWHQQIQDSLETVLIPEHSEQAGLSYAPSGGIDLKGELFVPFPFPPLRIPFDDRYLQDSDDSDDSGEDSSSSEEEDEERMPPRQLETSRARSVDAAGLVDGQPTKLRRSARNKP